MPYYVEFKYRNMHLKGCVDDAKVLDGYLVIREHRIPVHDVICMPVHRATASVREYLNVLRLDDPNNLKDKKPLGPKKIRRRSYKCT